MTSFGSHDIKVLIRLMILNMNELTDRQIRILKTIIEEYMESAEPIGSQRLEKKYELGVSPATIRNEMAYLTKSGYLKQPHTSAGRVPTKQAFKFYVDRLMDEKKLSVAEEVAAKEKVWDARFDFDQLLEEAVKALAQQTKMLTVGASSGGKAYHAGYPYLLDAAEFYDIDITKTVLSFLDETESLLKLFERSVGQGPVHYLLGEDLGYSFLEPCGMVFAGFEAGRDKRGWLGVIGPSRLNYPQVVPTVRHFGSLIEELGRSL